MFDLDENRPDYFDTPEQPDRSQRPVAGDRIDLTDGGEYPFDGHPRRSRLRRFVWWTVAVCVILLGIVAYFRYFSPYVTDARIDGYVMNVERRGLIFKTYEAEVVSRTALTDTARVYSHSVAVSIPSATLARRLQSLQGTARPVILTVQRYWGVLPWRGSSTTVVVAADEVKPSDNRMVSHGEAATARL